MVGFASTQVSLSFHSMRAASTSRDCRLTESDVKEMLHTQDFGFGGALLEQTNAAERLPPSLIPELEIVEAERRSWKVEVLLEAVHPKVRRSGIDGSGSVSTGSTQAGEVSI